MIEMSPNKSDAANSPKDELNLLLNDAVNMAVRLLEKHGSHIPFCLAVTTSGERTSIAADDSKMPGAEALLADIRRTPPTYEKNVESIKARRQSRG